MQHVDDGLVHVTVNGKDAWSGTEREFRSLIIDTGDGNDVVYNNVSFATIVTGDGNDKVVENGGGSSIFTGNGDDYVHIKGGMLGGGGGNVINTGDGKDTVTGGEPPSFYFPDSTSTDGNQIDTGEGDDYVNILGEDNVINTGGGKDTAIAKAYFEGGSNTIDGEKRKIVEE